MCLLNGENKPCALMIYGRCTVVLQQKKCCTLSILCADQFACHYVLRNLVGCVLLAIFSPIVTILNPNTGAHLKCHSFLCSASVACLFSHCQKWLWWPSGLGAQGSLGWSAVNYMTWSKMSLVGWHRLVSSNTRCMMNYYQNGWIIE